MLRYRPAGGASAEADGWAPFVRDVLLRPGGATSATPSCAPLAGAYAFVCAHAKRDKRCGVCGPPLIAALRAAAAASGAPLAVRACSHVGGHAYAGNVLVFDRAAGVPRGTWLGYVAPEDVPAIVDDLVGRGAPPQPRLWCVCPMLRLARSLTHARLSRRRGSMGMSIEAVKAEAQELFEACGECATGCDKP
jgi:(2Fe-2S) ferredoxin